MKALRTAALLAAGGVFLLGGCSIEVSTASIPKEELQQKVSSSLEKQVGQKPDKIECPGDLKAEKGRTARCVLTAGGVRIGTTVEVTSVDDDGKYQLDIQVDKKPMN